MTDMADTTMTTTHKVDINSVEDIAAAVEAAVEAMRAEMRAEQERERERERAKERERREAEVRALEERLRETAPTWLTDQMSIASEPYGAVATLTLPQGKFYLSLRGNEIQVMMDNQNHVRMIITYCGAGEDLLATIVDWLAQRDEPEDDASARDNFATRERARIEAATAQAEEFVARAQSHIERANHVEAPLVVLETHRYNGRTVLVSHSQDESLLTATILRHGGITLHRYGGRFADHDEDGERVSTNLALNVVEMGPREIAALMQARATYLEEVQTEEIEKAQKHLDAVRAGDTGDF